MPFFVYFPLILMCICGLMLTMNSAHPTRHPIISAIFAGIGAASSSSSTDLLPPEPGEDYHDVHTTEKVSPEQLECFADYLVTVKGAKTEIFEEKHLFGFSWGMKHAIVRQQKIENLTVFEREMAEDIGKAKADECFTRNRELLSHVTNSNGTEVEILVKISKLFERSANGRLQLSDRLNKKFGVSPQQLECFADYLVLAKCAKTEIFAEKENKKGKSSWQMKRAVVRHNQIENLRIYKREMAKEMGEHQADKCFTRNRAQLHENAGNAQVTNTDKGKEQVEFFVKLWELFDRSANGRLEVSEKMNKNLAQQSACLATFLNKNFGMEHLHMEKIYKRMDEMSEKDAAILEANKVSGHEWENDVIVRWKWVGEVEGQKMPEIRFEEATATNQHFWELKKCHEIVPVKDGIIQEGGSSGRKLVLNSMLARFKDDQVFVDSEPEKSANLIIGHLAVVKEKQCPSCHIDFVIGDKVHQMYPSNHVFHNHCTWSTNMEWRDESVTEEKRCPICLEDFVHGDKVKQLNVCRHIYHKHCIEKWLEVKETCPFCRTLAVQKVFVDGNALERVY